MQTKINIKTKDLGLNSELREHLNEKIKHLEKFMSLNSTEAPILDVQLEKQFAGHHKRGQVYRAELNLNYRGKVMRTESLTEDILLSFDDACDEMTRRVRKKREKKTDLVRCGAKKIKKILRDDREE